IFTRKGKKYARFKNAKNKATTALLSQDNKKIIVETSKWYIEYRDNNDVIKRAPGFTDRKATEQYANELDRNAERVRSGYKPKEHEQLNRPLAEHLQEFYTSLVSKEDDTSYVNQTVKRIKRVFDECKCSFWKDISASKFSNCISRLKYRGQNISTQTKNYYIQSIKQFCRWMVQDGRADKSPVEHLKPVTVVPTFERRAGTPDELRWLLETTESEPKRFGLSGHERAILYRFAAETGLRAKEIRNLKVSDFDFGNSVVIAKAGYTKNKDKGAIPLKQESAAVFKDFLTGKMPNVQAFKMPSKYNMARMLKADLKQAGIKYVDEHGCKFDFHALRHTFITSLRTAPTRVAQSLARHKSSKMTDRYTHIELYDERAVVEKHIPDYSEPSNQEKGIATGTDDFVLKIDDNNKPDNKTVTENPQTQADKGVTKSDNGFLIRRSQVRVLPGVL
ncbi:MAG: tyrosine-type recombinase/integrase, partial [Planctomycetota bacterium]